MALEDTSATAPETTDAPEAAPSSSEPRKVAPLNADGRKKRAEKERVRRRLERLKELPSDKLDELLAITEGKAVAAAEPASPARVEQVQAAEPGQIPGWPAPSAIAEQLPLALMIWGGLADKAKGTRYAKCLEAQTHELHKDDGSTVKVRIEPVQKLAEGTAPVLAKYMPSGSSLSPEGALLLSVAMIFGPELLKQAGELAADFINPKPRPLSEEAPRREEAH